MRMVLPSAFCLLPSAFAPSFFCLLLSAFCLPRGHRHVVAVDDFIVRALAQCAGDLFGFQSFDFRQVGGGIVR